MSDDIVTRLRLDKNKDFHNDLMPFYYSSPSTHNDCLGLMHQAADEIERLRAIIQDIANAATDEGIKPGYHKQQVNYLKTMWNPLWQAIGKAVKEANNE